MSRLGRILCQPARSLLPRRDDVPCTRNNVSAREKLLLAHAAHSPKPGRCAASCAQRPGLGESGELEQRKRPILPQRPCLGEKRARKVPALESRREGPARLPADLSNHVSPQKDDSLQRRDLAQTRADSGAREAVVLQSKDNAPLFLRNVSAWESLLQTCEPSPPKAGRCATVPGATSRLGRDSLIRAANLSDSRATSRLGRDKSAQDPGLGEATRRTGPFTCGNVESCPCQKWQFSPKAGSCAGKGLIPHSKG